MSKQSGERVLDGVQRQINDALMEKEPEEVLLSVDKLHADSGIPKSIIRRLVFQQDGERMEREKPEWACSQWGQYEHDWMDCPECIQAYEEVQEAFEGIEEHTARELGIDGQKENFSATQ